MFLLRSLLFRWLWRRLTGRGRQQPPRRSAFGRGSVPTRYARGARGGGRAGRGGFFGPLPYYSTRTRGGSRVTVSGCCLPLALGMFALPALALRAALRRLS